MPRWPERTLRERLLDKVEQAANGCWLWTGARDQRGYPRFGVRYGDRWRAIPAYRVSYEEFVGAIPKGLHIDHLCREPLCVNPEHLEPVTNAENHRRARRAVCGRGHPFTVENTRVDKHGNRACRACGAFYAARSRAKRRAAE